MLAIRRVLSILAVLGLVLAPVTAPAVAGGMDASIAMMATSDDGATANEMPCCPPEKPVMPDCMKACPLLTLCMAKTLHGVSSAATVMARLGLAEVFRPANDTTPDLLAQGPPPRPPQA